eukprot:TRINITY_DN50207_c0_g1_i1.p1 TRINITY_DN50207_c0_g1~~TRINITY_DN50207_c0_g1_i1.p1  ORF type:complete len:479 (-),score=81.77 TRINITY_DN50207_c0_g1_i1:28-1464(-)
MVSAEMRNLQEEGIHSRDEKKIGSKRKRTGTTPTVPAAPTVNPERRSAALAALARRGPPAAAPRHGPSPAVPRAAKRPATSRPPGQALEVLHRSCRPSGALVPPPAELPAPAPAEATANLPPVLELLPDKSVKPTRTPAEDYFIATQHAASNGSGRAMDLSGDIKSVLGISEGRKLPYQLQIDRATERCRNEFGGWLSQMRGGANLLFYGFGSKRQLLLELAQRAHEELIQEDEELVVVVMNGYSGKSDVVMKHALGLIAKHVAAEQCPGNLASLRAEIHCALLEPASSRRRAKRVLVVVHNLEQLGSAVVEQLEMLVTSSKVHVLASVDQLYSGTGWDASLMTGLRWCWCHAGSYEPYTVETKAHAPEAFEAAGCETAGVSSVLGALTKNSQDVFKILLVAQLASADHSGLPYHTLYDRCNRNFLVTTDAAFKTHLVELESHEIIKRKKTAAAEVLYIQMDKAALRQLHQQMSEEGV